MRRKTSTAKSGRSKPRSKPGKVVHKSQGKTTGLGIISFLCSLFEANEFAPPRKRLTDEQIAIELEREFPARPSAFKYRDPNANVTINSRRQSYNRGEFDSAGIPPERLSFRYNSKGLPVEPRKGNRLLLDEEISFLKASHDFDRQRLIQKKFPLKK